MVMRHDVSLHLRHEVHGHHDDDEQRGAASRTDVPSQYQELGQQADQGHVDGSREGQSQEDLLEILRRLLACRMPGTKAPDFFRLSAVSFGLYCSAV